MQRRWSQALFSVVASDWWKWAQNETWEVPSKHQQTLLYCVSDCAMDTGYLKRLWSLLYPWRYSKAISDTVLGEQLLVTLLEQRG